jgi:hypothetical protein
LSCHLSIAQPISHKPRHERQGRQMLAGRVSTSAISILVSHPFSSDPIPLKRLAAILLNVPLSCCSRLCYFLSTMSIPRAGNVSKHCSGSSSKAYQLFLMQGYSSAKTVSIGFKSGEQGGKNRTIVS